MLQIGNEWYVRSIQCVNGDGSLTFACAIATGLPLTVGEGTGLLPTLNKQIYSIKNTFSSIEITIGCDYIHRRLEILQTELKEDVELLIPIISPNVLGILRKFQEHCIS